MTLIEAVMALMVMSVATASIFGLINHVQGANRSVNFQNTALDVFAQVAAQIRDARCDYPASTPGVANGVADPSLLLSQAGWFGSGGPAAGSLITLLGDATNNPRFSGLSTPIRVDMRTVPTNTGPGSPTTSFRVDVRVRQIMRDPTKDDINLVDGYWIRVFPVEKACASRTDPNGRGEY